MSVPLSPTLRREIFAGMEREGFTTPNSTDMLASVAENNFHSAFAFLGGPHGQGFLMPTDPNARQHPLQSVLTMLPLRDSTARAKVFRELVGD